jgi:tetratricopeptide (TPR) repeat protein
MKKVLLLILICQISCNSQQNCAKGINLLPMYGEVEKCENQIKIDNDFILESEKKFESIKIASEYYISKGWEYYYANKNDLSMKRFNQAWILDKNNSEIYWGFGNLLGKKGEFKKSVKYLLKSIEIEPKNAKVYESISTSYSQIFYKTKDIQYLNLTIEYLKKVVKIEPKNGRAFGQLANSYAYLTQKDSLRKYIKITDGIDSKFINPEIRKIVNEK